MAVAHPMAVTDEAKLRPEGVWSRATRGSGFVGKDYAVASGNASATWSITLPSPGTYEVFLRWPRGRRLTSKAVCRLGSREINVNQRRGAGKWVRVGKIQVKRPERFVVVLRGSDERTLAADAIRFVEK